MADTPHDETSNKALVTAAFDRWRERTGSPFELLDADASWTIVGSSPLSKTYTRKDFLEQVIGPFNARVSVPLKPTVRGVWADGDMVIILFDGVATASDGQEYRNTYTWYFRMREGRVVEATAFFDTRTFDDLWTRVTPHPPAS
ncbi:MAG: nuclear transport factor 2 family protein [bacterium]|nr:nuclear transport factor 2 family protein [bacterium]